jgi:hypothetical protein
MEKPEYVLSGNCRQGNVGERTALCDTNGSPLCVGDIVCLATKDSYGISCFYGISVVVSDRWTTYSDGTNREKVGGITHFIMGIKDSDFMAEDSEWYVKKVKSYSDVISGEHWIDYGFNYQ